MKTVPMQLFTYNEESFSPQEESVLIAEIKELLKEKQAVLVAHYYTSAAIQKLSEETGGIVSDSLEMAKFGSKQTAPLLIVAGVKFMGETAKILNPEKTILMPTLEAECSLDLSCPIEEFSAWCDSYPDRVVVVYANTSAEVKARADWVVTSGSALAIVQKLHAEGKKILWGPDKHLGAYVQEKSGADMLLWNGSCIVHEAFKEKELKELMLQHPDAKVLVHPESPQAVIALADVVGSTTALINAVRDLPSQKFIVATDNGIFYKMKALAPEKILLEAPTAGAGATCKSCAHCPWMAMNGLSNLRDVLLTANNEIKIEESVRAKAEISVRRLMNFR